MSKETKPKPKTRDELLIENATLKEQLNDKMREDMEIRSQLSEILDCFSIKKDFYGRSEDREVELQSWISIACLIGELKADANYSILLETKEEQRSEIENKAKEIYYLKNKIDKDTIFTPKCGDGGGSRPMFIPCGE